MDLCMVTVPHIMARLEGKLDYRGVQLERFRRIFWITKAIRFSLFSLQ